MVMKARNAAFINPWLGRAARLGLIAAALLVIATPAGSQTTTQCGVTPGDCCNKPVSGNVVFKGDVQCTDSSGLIVVASNTTINFNGFRLQCAAPGTGFHNSCQGLGMMTEPDVGVVIKPGLSNVRVKGAGSLVGFDQGVLIDGGPYSKASGHQVERVHVSGPDAMGGLFELSVTGVAGERPPTQGIVVLNVKCPPYGWDDWGDNKDGGSRIKIHRNSVDNHTIGVLLSDANCVEVNTNFLHDANSGRAEFAGQASHGIRIEGSGNTDWDGSKKGAHDNLLHGNMVIDSGINVPDDSGVALVGNATRNRISNNTVSYNNGDGIRLLGGAIKNRFSNNTLNLNTSTEPTAPSCTDADALLTGCSPNPVANGREFYDLADDNPPGANQFDANNKCETENPNVPSTVCNPGETQPPAQIR